MATANRKPPVQRQLVQQLLLGVLEDALNLANRFKEGEMFRQYVFSRLPLIVPMGLLMLLTSFGCAAATILFIGGTRPVLVLFAILLVPFVVVGSLFVQVYVFFSWIENRALAKSLGHATGPAPGPVAAWLKRKLGADLGARPPVPWVLAAIFLVLPLVMLFAVTPTLALALVVLLIAAPILYARFES